MSYHLHSKVTLNFVVLFEKIGLLSLHMRLMSLKARIHISITHKEGSNMDHWLNRNANKEYVQRLRSLLSEQDTQVFIFLGAGFSFGVERGKIMFEHSEFDDSRRFP